MLVIRNTSAYGFGVTSRLPFDQTIKWVKTAFEAEGFGVVSEIDVRETLCDKLGASIPPYTILGFCNPRFVLRALRDEPEAGLLMPCNVIVRADGRQIQVSVMNPHLLTRVTENNQLRSLSDEIFNRMESALERFVKISGEALTVA